MKLLFCPECKDIILLHLSDPDRNTMKCFCGKTEGYYYNSTHANHNGFGVPFMISNPEFLKAVNEFLESPTIQIERPFTAAIIPRECQTLKVKD